MIELISSILLVIMLINTTQNQTPYAESSTLTLLNQDSAEFEKLIDKANQSFSNKHFETAISEFHESIRELELSPLRIRYPDRFKEYLVYCKLQIFFIMLEKESPDLLGLEQLFTELLILFDDNEISTKKRYSEERTDFKKNSLELAELIGKQRPEQAIFILRSVLTQGKNPKLVDQLDNDEIIENAFLNLYFGQFVAHEYQLENCWNLALAASRGCAWWLNNISLDNWSDDTIEMNTDACMLEADALYNLSKFEESVQVLKSALIIVENSKDKKRKELLSRRINLDLAHISLGVGKFDDAIKWADKIISVSELDEETSMYKFNALLLKREALKFTGFNMDHMLDDKLLDQYNVSTFGSPLWIQHHFAIASLHLKFDRLIEANITSSSIQLLSSLNQLRLSALTQLKMADTRGQQLEVRIFLIDLDFFAYKNGMVTESFPRIEEGCEWLALNFPYSSDSIDRRVRFELLKSNSLEFFEDYLNRCGTQDLYCILYHLESLAYLEVQSDKSKLIKSRLLSMLEDMGVSVEYLKKY